MRKRPVVSLTPLIDVVFILLVFFMLASSLQRNQAIELRLAGSHDDIQAERDTRMMSVTMDSNGFLIRSRRYSSEELLALVSSEQPAQLIVTVTEDVSLQSLLDLRQKLDAMAVGDIFYAAP